MSKSRQAALLTALLVVLGVIVVRPFLGGGSIGRGDAGGDDGAVRGAAAGAVVEVDLAALERKPGQLSPGRDPFRFAPKKAPPPPPPPPPPQQVNPAPAPPPPQQAAAEPPRPQPPPIDFTFLGSFGPHGRRIAVFSDQAEIYNVQVGDRIKDKFVLRDIGFESVDVGFVDFPQEPAKRLPVGG